MDVQVTVLVGPVLDNKRMCRVEARRRVAPVVCRKQRPRERQQHEPLQRYDERLEADVVDDDACANERDRCVDGVEADAVAAPYLFMLFGRAAGSLDA